MPKRHKGLQGSALLYYFNIITAIIPFSTSDYIKIQRYVQTSSSGAKNDGQAGDTNI